MYLYTVAVVSLKETKRDVCLDISKIQEREHIYLDTGRESDLYLEEASIRGNMVNW